MANAFPSLIVSSKGFEARGSFAENQARYLDPDEESVARLRQALEAANAGIVAHFYMDAELQGTLYAVDWPHIHVSDSLVMADRGVSMAEAGVENLVVLGVDFMSENVRAMVDASGFESVGVYRVADDPIGCSLAEAAESRAYAAYLEQAAKVSKPVHVIYINTSLRTKAQAHHRVPTITCTSSNVVRTVLQAFAQDPEVEVFFGPDTYMGENLAAMFKGLLDMDDETIKSVHPAHDLASMQRVVDNFHYFKQGNCIVHHMFGADVVAQVRAEHQTAHVTAHLEVPGEMFELGLEAQKKGRGVVGSTSNILGYIESTIRQACETQADGGDAQTISFVLGTEAGMTTAIVRKLRGILAEYPNSGVAAEIIFPVASEAVATTNDENLPLIPGVSGGEGCTTAGGCATCPFMKMNTFDALIDILEAIPKASSDHLAAFFPKAYDEVIDGKTVAQLGSQPILHMRHFQTNGTIPDELLAR